MEIFKRRWDADVLFSFGKLHLVKSVKIKATIHPENLKLTQEQMKAIHADLVEAVDGVFKKHEVKNELQAV